MRKYLRQVAKHNMRDFKQKFKKDVMVRRSNGQITRIEKSPSVFAHLWENFIHEK